MAVDLNTSAERTPPSRACCARPAISQCYEMIAGLTGCDRDVRVRCACCGRDFHTAAETVFLAMARRRLDVDDPDRAESGVRRAAHLGRRCLRRRLRAAWWIFVIWWIIIPQLGRIFSIITGGPLLQIAGLVIMSAVLVIVWRARPQFQARGARRNLLAAIICFLLGGVVILVLGTWLVSTFGTTPDL